MGRLASELDISMVTVEEQADKPDAASAAAEEPTDKPAILTGIMRKPAWEPDTPLSYRRWEKRRRIQVAPSPAG